MLKKISSAVFWLLFFGFFLYKLVPKHVYLTDGLPGFMGKKTFFDWCIFALHIFLGILVYCTAVLQFTPFVNLKIANSKSYVVL